MLTLDVKAGQGVQIGDVAFIKVIRKDGARVRLGFLTAVHPITIIAEGVIPQVFAVGITGERRPVPKLAYG
jgi:sRNA-binding carbon storage regulator CsrA